MRRPISITMDRREIIVRGNAKLLLEAGGFRGPYLASVRGWILDGHRLPDLTAYLEYRRVPYVVTGASDAA